MPTNEDRDHERAVWNAGREAGLAAYDAACMALIEDATVPLASIRMEIAHAATSVLLDRSDECGRIALPEIVNSDPSAVASVNRRMRSWRGTEFAHAARVALAAAARVLAEG